MWVSSASSSVDESISELEWDSGGVRQARTAVIVLAWLEVFITFTVTACLLLTVFKDKCSANQTRCDSDGLNLRELHASAERHLGTGKVYTPSAYIVEVDETPGALDKHFSLKPRDSISF